MNGGYTIVEMSDSFSMLQWLQIVTAMAFGGFFVVCFCYMIWRLDQQSKGGKPVKFTVYIPSFILVILVLIGIPR